MSIGAQTEGEFTPNELDDPDENGFYDALLDQIFTPISMSATDIILRQRLQYSPSMNGWRILNKGRFINPNLSFNFLLEQDPTEGSLADHAVFTLSSDQVPGVDKLLIGDFNLRWGAGFLQSQNTRRSSLNPTSLTSRILPNIRPHYSTRETDYFHGLAIEKQMNSLNTVMFASKRRTLGQVKDGTFREDTDGIHSADRTYESQSIIDFGFAGIYDWRTLTLYSAVRMNSFEGKSTQYELGAHWQYSGNQLFQIFIDNFNPARNQSIINWYYKTKTLGLSAQYRYFQSFQTQTFGTELAQLGSTSKSEHGFSLRLLVSPRRGLRLNYAIDLGQSRNETTLYETRSLNQHKAQIKFARSNREWQYDWSYKFDGPIYPTDLWQGEMDFLKITKYALSLNERFSPSLWYRVNLKAATNNEHWSILIQQRMGWLVQNWKLAMGYVRYNVPNHTLRISIYETGLVESFNFFTAFADGQRWFLYLRYSSRRQSSFEFQIAQTTAFPQESVVKYPSLSFQLSIVL
jgi:opacity protein-like surface antigen